MKKKTKNEYSLWLMATSYSGLWEKNNLWVRYNALSILNEEEEKLLLCTYLNKYIQTRDKTTTNEKENIAKWG